MTEKPEKILGLNRGFCEKCQQPRIISTYKPYFCLTCGSYKIILGKKGA